MKRAKRRNEKQKQDPFAVLLVLAGDRLQLTDEQILDALDALRRVDFGAPNVTALIRELDALVDSVLADEVHAPPDVVKLCREFEARAEARKKSEQRGVALKVVTVLLVVLGLLWPSSAHARVFPPVRESDATLSYAKFWAALRRLLKAFRRNWAGTQRRRYPRTRCGTQSRWNGSCGGSRRPSTYGRGSRCGSARVRASYARPERGTGLSLSGVAGVSMSATCPTAIRISRSSSRTGRSSVRRGATTETRGAL